MLNPLPGSSVTSEYGNRTLNGAGNFHIGIDLGAPEGALILAADDGVVAYAGDGANYAYGDWTYGNIVVLAHDNGNVTRYAHCHSFIAKKGQRVKAGDPIAKVGNTGNSFGAHLHFETYIQGKRVNPRELVDFDSKQGVSPVGNFKVCIDAGHGGTDPGAGNASLGLQEKNITLEIALMTKEKLQASGVDCTVIMTRDTDVKLGSTLAADLSNRAKVSNDHACDAFLSIHLNAFNTQAKGIETYSYNGANTPQLAKAIHRRLIDSGHYSFDRGLKTANFAVLRETYCIAALCEMAFIDNNEDIQHVLNNKASFADAFAHGICDYFGVEYKGTTAPKDMPQETLYDMPILGENYLDAKIMANYVLSINPDPKIGCTALELAQLFLDEGKAEGVRGDIAFAQSCKETGYFKYGGQVLPEQNNYAGIGATNNSPTGKGAWFATPQEGVRAQIQHLKAYASTDDLVMPCVDPRFNLVPRGSATTWVGLAGKWAYPGYDPDKYSSVEEARLYNNDYGSTIIQIYVNMKENYNPDVIATYPPMENTPDGWAVEVIEWAKEEGLLVGDPDGNIRPRDGVTRQELAAVLHRVLVENKGR